MASLNYHDFVDTYSGLATYRDCPPSSASGGTLWSCAPPPPRTRCSAAPRSPAGTRTRVSASHSHTTQLTTHTVLYISHYTTHISHYTSHTSHYTTHNSTPCWWLPPAPACPRSATRAPRRSSPCRRGRSGAVKIITIFGEGFFRTWIWCNFRKISLTALNNTMENLSGYLYLIVVLLPLEQLITNCG